MNLHFVFLTRHTLRMDMTGQLSQLPYINSNSQIHKYTNTKPNSLKSISYVEQDQMIIDQFHRHRRQCSIAAVPLGPTTPVGICCDPTFVSEPDWFRCHGSDLLERILQIFVCWQKRFTFRNHSRAKIGEIGWRYFLPWLRQGVVCVWFWAPDEFGRHRSDVTGPVTWLQQLEDSQHNKSETASLRITNWLIWGNTRVDREELGKGIEGDMSPWIEPVSKMNENHRLNTFHGVWNPRNTFPQSSALRADWTRNWLRNVGEILKFLFQILAGEFSGAA